MQATVGGEVEELSGLVGSLSGFARGLDPDALLAGDAVKLMAVAARGESILATIKALASVRVDDTKAWKHAGFRSAADYAAPADPDAERDLLDSAEHDDFSSFKDKARRAKAAADPDPEERPPAVKVDATPPRRTWPTPSTAWPPRGRLMPRS